MTTPIDRRTLLQRAGLASASAAFSGLAPPSLAGAPSAQDTRLIDHPGLVHRKLAYSLDSSLTFSWLRGLRYAMIDMVAHPLWDMHLGTMFRTRDLADGYEVTLLSTAFYTDLKTGEYLTKFDNPFTKTTVDMFYFPPKPQTLVYGSNGRVIGEKQKIAGITPREIMGPVWIDGDTITVFADDLIYSADTPAPAHKVRVNDLSSYQGRTRDVADPKMLNPPSRMIFNDMNVWPPWLGMGDIQGNYFSRAWGCKAFAYAEMPPIWRGLMEQHYPEIARDPGAALDAAPKA
jgi:hypothetical protein